MRGTDTPSFHSRRQSIASFVGLAALAACCQAGGWAHAAGIPGIPTDKPIQLVTQYAPGGGSDLLGRLVVEKLGIELGQAVVLLSKPGASGGIATNYVATAKPDGSTLLLGSGGGVTMVPHLMNPKSPQDPLKILQPVAMFADAPLLLLVTSKLPVKSYQDLITLARKEPGSLYYASSGNGTSPHVAGALFAKMAGIDIRHVPYKGSGPTYVDLVAGRTQLMFSGLGISQPFLQRGEIRVLANGGKTRSPNLPDVPTLDELGLKGYRAGTWYGVLAPKDVPAETVARLNQVIRKILAMPDVKARILADNYSMEDSQMTPDEFRKRIETEFEMWGKTLPELNITLD